MTVPVTLPPKKDVMLALLERSSVFIHLDPRGEKVIVPPWFKKQPQLVLQVGLNMAVRIPDLAVEDEAISCTLSFSRAPFFCYIPLGSVFALFGEDGKGMVWPGDVPKEVAAQQAERAAREEAKARLKPVEAPPEPPAARAAPAAAPAKEKRSRKSRKSDAGASASADAPRAGKERAPRAEKPVATPPPAREAPPVAPVREAKRPLPPYLRVVK